MGSLSPLDLREVLPSIATTPSGTPIRDATQATKQRWKCSASREARDVAQVIVGRRALGEGPKPAQQIELLVAETGYIGDGFSARQHRKQAQ